MPPSDDQQRGRPRPRTSDITMPTGLDAILDGVAAAPVLEVAVPLRPGERLGDRDQFVVVEGIGRGGMSHVYLARDAQLGRRVALKVLAKTSPQARELFESEARKTAGLQHPHIVTLFEAGVHDGRPYLVLEHLRGETLADRIRRGPIPPREALILAGQIAAAVAHAHAAGLVHRDLKPQNVFLVDGAFVKVLDFGIAALMHAAEDGAGTPVYMAPEQRRGDAVDARTDIWAIGAVLYECLTGIMAANAAKAEATGGPARPVPAAIQPLLARALNDDPAQRHPNAAVLGDDIERALIMLATDVETPYRSLDAFGEEQAEWFLGRRRESARLRAAMAEHRVIALAGQSGAGKSSLLAAGVIPRVKGEGWNVVSLRPGRNPVTALANGARAAGGEVDEQAWMRWPGIAATQLAGLALARPNLGRDVGPSSSGRPSRRRAEIVEEPTQQTLVTPVSVLIAIHHAEDLVTRADPAEALAFATILAAACDDPNVDFHVVMTLRTDYLDPMARSPLLREDLAHIHLLDAPSEAELRTALVEPARRLGFSYDPELADDVVKAVRGERAPLPFLQFVASRLWEERDEDAGTVPRDALERLGGLGGILARHAESVYETLPTTDNRDWARAILSRLLDADGSPREVDRSALLSGLPPDAGGVLDTLARARVVSVGRDALALGHPSLARQWSRLREWSVAGAGERAFRERLSQAATHWADGGRRSGLLWGADALGEAVRRVPNLTLTPVETAFFEACRKHARRQRHVRRAVLAGLAVLAAAAVVAAIIATSSRIDVAEAHARARSRELAAAAIQELQRDPELSIVLARAAVERERTPEAVSALQAALRRNLPVREFGGFDQGVTAFAFAPTGAFVVAGGRDGIATVLPVDGGDPVELKGHEDAILSATVSADGVVATASADGTARLWRADGTELRTVQAAQGSVYSAAFRPGVDQFVTAGSDGRFRVWSFAGQDLGGGSIGATNQIWHATFLPDGEHVLTGFQPAVQGRFLGVTPRANDVRLFRADGTQVHAFVTETDRHYSAATVTVVEGTRDRPSRLLISHHPGGQRLYALDGTVTAEFTGHIGAVWHLVGSADGALVAGGSNDRTVRVWRSNGELVTVLRGHEGLVRSVAFHPDGEHILSSSWDGLSRLFDREGRQVGTFADGGTATARLSPDGSFVVTSGPTSVRLWKTLPTPPLTVALERTPAIIATRGEHVYVTSAVGITAFRAHDMESQALWKGLAGRTATPDGRRMLALDGEPERIIRMDLDDSGLELQREVLRWPGGCSPSTASVRGDVAAAGCASGHVAVWTGAGPPAYSASLDAAVNTVLVHPRGFVVAASHKGRATVWNVAGKVVCDVQAHDAPIWSLLAVEDGFLTGSSDTTARLWDGACAPRATLEGHTGGIVFSSLSPDGEQIVTASWDGTARTWDRDGAPLARFTGHEDTVTWAGFSADGARFATTSGDDTARLWTPDGQPLAVLSGHKDGVLTGAFSEDGRRFVTASRDGTVVSHLTDVDELLERAADRAMRPLTADETERYHLME